MRLPSSFVPLAVLFLSCAAPPAAAQGGRPGSPGPVARPRPPAPQDESAPRKPSAAVFHGIPSGAEENEGGEADPPFDAARFRVARAARGAPSASANVVRLPDHPRAQEIAQAVVEALCRREIDVALLGGRRYMANDCLGIKASAGTFRMKFENPSFRFEDLGLTLAFSIDRISFDALNIRIRPNPNVLELCKFSKKFEVGGSAEDVKLELRIAPLLDLERCRVGGIVDSRVTIRIGNLNLKPLQNDLDRLAKNMIEDALTNALQCVAEGPVSVVQDQILQTIDDILELDCPTRPGDLADSLGKRLPGVFGGGDRGGTPAETGSSGEVPGGRGPDVAVADDLSTRVEALEALARDLESRIAGLEGAAKEEAPTPAASEESAPPAASGVAYEVSANPELKGRMGRIVVAFPESAETSGTNVQVFREGDRLQNLYGSVALELLPGTYAVEVGGSRVKDVVVASGHDSRVRVGVLRVQAAPETAIELFDPKEEEAGSDGEAASRKEKKGKRIDHFYGSKDLGLPIGTFEVSVQGQRERVEIREGHISAF